MKQFNSSPEPAPDWKVALKKWGILWSGHIYLFGVTFAIMTLWNIWTLINLICPKNRRVSLKTKKCFVMINILLLYYNLIRSVNLLVDPYSSNMHSLIPSKDVSFLLWGISIPCFTASFMMIHLVMLEITKLQLYSRKLQNLKFIGGIVATHFILVITVEIIVLLYPTMNSLLIICQVFLLCLGLIISCSALYGGIKVVRYIKSTQRSLHEFREMSPIVPMHSDQVPITDIADNSNEKVRKPKHMASTSKTTQRHPTERATYRITVITIITASCGFLYSAMQIYSMSVVYNLSDTESHPELWHWFVYQSASRILEIGMVGCMSYIARAPSYHFC